MTDVNHFTDGKTDIQLYFDIILRTEDKIKYNNNCFSELISGVLATLTRKMITLPLLEKYVLRCILQLC
jgi:hypothetical protein